MSFKIKAIDADDPNFDKKEKKYYGHFKKFNMNNNSDLWKFFGYDFFHDGIINKISFEKGLNKVLFDIYSPNIKYFRTQDEFEFINVDFCCTFNDVPYFNIETPSRPNDNSVDYFVFEEITFLSSEINSLEDLISAYSKAYDENFYSLIIELLGDSNKFYLKMVFSNLTVIPKEPLAFNLMLDNKKYEMPLFISKEK